MSEQNPVAWMGQNPRDGSIELCQFKPAPSVLLDFNMKPLYANPTPDVAAQLVDALRMIMDEPDALDGRPRTYEYVQKALAAAKEAGL